MGTVRNEEERGARGADQVLTSGLSEKGKL